MKVGWANRKVLPFSGLQETVSSHLGITFPKSWFSSFSLFKKTVQRQLVLEPCSYDKKSFDALIQT